MDMKSKTQKLMVVIIIFFLLSQIILEYSLCWKFGDVDIHRALRHEKQ